MDTIINLVLQGLGALALAGVTAVIALVFKRMGVALSEERRIQLENVVRQAILKAEEWAAEELKKKVGERVPFSKLEIATADVLAKLPNVTAEEAQSVIAAVLPSLGIGAAAGAHELGKAVRTRK